MRLDWNRLLRGRQKPDDGAEVVLDGEIFPLEDAPPDRVLLVREADCCAGCLPSPETTVDVRLRGLAPRYGAVSVAGVWRIVSDAASWRWRIEGARVVPRATNGPWLSRRAVLAAPLLCAAPRAFAATQVAPDAGRALAAQWGAQGGGGADLHSHAGRVILSASLFDRPFLPVAAPMREGGMAIVSLAIVSDTPVAAHERPFRTPDPGELWANGQAAFARLHQLARQEQFDIVVDRASLARCARPGAQPAIVVASEGADWLDDRIERLDWAFREQRLRHLQLTHMRPNDLGDIQTVAPVHNGLTDFGAEVVRGCNRLGIVVDVAHAPLSLVARAASVSSKPIVLSHTALVPQPPLYSRLISVEHARVVAQTGGVIGVWPVTGGTTAPGVYARMIAYMVDAVGVDHVGIGSDMRGLGPKPNALENYTDVPALLQALLEVGFSTEEVRKLAGGNYQRVLAATLPA
jgi:membrane dipeptidase